jgi:hypothetical protein
VQSTALPPLCCHRRSTSCLDSFHASFSPCPGPLPLPCCPLLRALRPSRATVGRHAPCCRCQLLLAPVAPLLALTRAQRLLRDLVYSLPHFFSTAFPLPRAHSLIGPPPPPLPTVVSRPHRLRASILCYQSTTVTHWCSPARSISSSRIRASPSTAPASTSSAAVSCLPWAAHSKPIRTTTTPQSAPPRPREALRPLHWLPSATHRLPDAHRRLPPPP